MPDKAQQPIPGTPQSSESKIDLRPIEDLLSKKFFIPSYQRGYRWTKQQVRALLNDINDFEVQQKEGKSTWYCLQPLAVRRMDKNDPRLKNLDEKEGWYEVIDGQQRLTTIYILLKIFNGVDGNYPQIVYETRQGSGTFLKGIENKTDADADNIDYYFMLCAKKTGITWKDDLKLTEQQIRAFTDKLVTHCKIIWYETGENGYEVFKRLNSGKLPLSNAELVKASLLKRENFCDLSDDAALLKQSEMAAEWDRMEQALHDNSFWYFVNPEPEAPRFDSTRIDFLLEFALRLEKDKNAVAQGPTKDPVAEGQKQNDYYVFSEFSDWIKSNSSNCWESIQTCFRTMKAWYDDRELYHYIGYLMNRKGGDKVDILRGLLRQAGKSMKSEFLSYLKETCSSTIIEHGECALQELDYVNNKEKIHNILLLFNLATTQNQISEMARYPFDRHFEAAKQRWSLEHIHAQNEKRATWKEEQFSKIKNFLSKIHVSGIESLHKHLKDKKSSADISDDAYKAIIGAFMGEKIEYDAVKRTFSSAWEKDDHLTNMALLQGDKNASFNNKLFPEKREKLAEYENAEQPTAFVPICTRNVFFKHYSPNSENPFVWDKTAGEEYVTVLTETVAAYLGLEAIIEQDNDGHLTAYGVKRRSAQENEGQEN